MRFHLAAALALLASLLAAEAQNETDAPVEAPVSAPVNNPPFPSFEEEAWGGCVPRGDEDHKVEIGKKTILCLHIGNNENWAGGVNYIRVSFQPEADQYSRLHIPNCTSIDCLLYLHSILSPFYHCAHSMSFVS